MPDEATLDRPRPIGAAAAGGAGVLAGAGLSTGLFSVIGIAKILGSPTGYSTAYPVVVFSLAALFLLTAALFSIRVNEKQRLIVIVGMATFILMAVVGSGLIFWEEYSRPTVTFTELFEPEEFTRGGMKSPQLRLTYRAIHGGTGDYAPFTNSPFSITKGDIIALRMEGIDELLRDYRATMDSNKNQSHMIRAVCAGEDAQKDPVCQRIQSLLMPTL